MIGNDPLTNERIKCTDIPVTPTNAHIPLTGMGQDRDDLKMAAKLLAAISSSLPNLEFDKMPGGIYNTLKKTLYIPVPGWRADTNSSDLAAFKPLADEFRKTSFVKKVYLVLVHDDNEIPSKKFRNEMLAQISSLFPTIALSAVGGINWANLDDIGT